MKATKLALVIIRANEITIENSKTGKVTAVVAILKVFGDKLGQWHPQGTYIWSTKGS